jgi:hypothetical protein
MDLPWRIIVSLIVSIGLGDEQEYINITSDSTGKYLSSFSMYNLMCIYVCFNMSVKTVKYFFTNMSTLLLLGHKIVLLMQCVELITDRLTDSRHFLN